MWSRGQCPCQRRQNSHLDSKLREPGRCDAHRVRRLLLCRRLFCPPEARCDADLSLFQESLQGTPGPSREDDNWLPVSRRHGHEERLHHQEQICGLKRANVPLPFPRLICCRCILFTLRKQSGGRSSPGLHARLFQNLPGT